MKRTLTDNEKGYLVYCWEQKGYNFAPRKYNESRNYTHYLEYFTDPAQNEKLIALVLSQKEN